MTGNKEYLYICNGSHDDYVAVVCSYHGSPDGCQSALRFALCKLQTVDVLQSSFVLAHLLVDDQLHTPAVQGERRNPFKAEIEKCIVLSQPGINTSKVTSGVKNNI